VIDDRKPVTVAPHCEGTEGPILRLRGNESAPAAVADENAARRPASLGSVEDRTGGESSRLRPANGDDGCADEPVLVVEVERKRDLLPVMAEQITGELSGCRRTVDPARERQRHLRFGMRRGCTKAHPADE